MRVMYGFEGCSYISTSNVLQLRVPWHRFAWKSWGYSQAFSGQSRTVSSCRPEAALRLSPMQLSLEIDGDHHTCSFHMCRHVLHLLNLKVLGCSFSCVLAGWRSTEPKKTEALGMVIVSLIFSVTTPVFLRVK